MLHRCYSDEREGDCENEVRKIHQQDRLIWLGGIGGYQTYRITVHSFRRNFELRRYSTANTVGSFTALTTNN